MGWVPRYACICCRLVHTYVKKLDLKLNKFIQYDGNTWYLINGQHYHTSEVKANPELLGYFVNPTEKSKSAETLSHQSTANVPSASPLPGLGKNRVWPKVTRLISACTQGHLTPIQYSCDWSSFLIIPPKIVAAPTLVPIPSLLSLGSPWPLLDHWQWRERGPR